MVKDLENVFIVIDALDECAKSGEREELLASSQRFMLSHYHKYT